MIGFSTDHPLAMNLSSSEFGIRVSKREEEAGIDYIFKEYNAYSSPDDIDQVVKELKRILADVLATNRIDTEEQQQKASRQAIKAIYRNDNLMTKLSLVRYSVRKEKLVEAVDHPLINIVLTGLEEGAPETETEIQNPNQNRQYFQESESE